MQIFNSYLIEMCFYLFVNFLLPPPGSITLLKSEWVQWEGSSHYHQKASAPQLSYGVFPNKPGL